MIEEGAQDFIRTVGEEGCYALTLCRVAEIEDVLNGTDIGTAVSGIDWGIKKGYIESDMTVADGAAFLKLLTGKEWTVKYQPANYKPVVGDILVAEWYNKRTAKTHFTLEYPVKWNSLQYSVTMKEGVIRSYRVYRVA